MTAASQAELASALARFEQEKAMIIEQAKAELEQMQKKITD